MNEIPKEKLAEIAKGLLPGECLALMPNTDPAQCPRRPLIKKGLVHFKSRVGNRFKSLMPTNLGYRVRDYLIEHGFVKETAQGNWCWVTENHRVRIVEDDCHLF